MAQPACREGRLEECIKIIVRYMQTPNAQHTLHHQSYIHRLQPQIEARFSELQGTASIPPQPIQSGIFFEAIMEYDRIFFNGKLSGNITVEFGPLRPDRLGETHAFQNKILRPRIIFDARKMHTEEEFRATALHEMTHACIYLQNCWCTECERTTSDLFQTGRTWHGWLWQRVAREVETLAERLWGKPIDILRKDAAMIELREGHDISALNYLRLSFGQVKGTEIYNSL